MSPYLKPEREPERKPKREPERKPERKPCDEIKSKNGEGAGEEAVR